MRLNRSPTVYGVMVKMTVRWRKITHGSWMESVRMILNTESTLVCYVSLFLLSYCYLLVIASYTILIYHYVQEDFFFFFFYLTMCYFSYFKRL